DAVWLWTMRERPERNGQAVPHRRTIRTAESIPPIPPFKPQWTRAQVEAMPPDEQRRVLEEIDRQYRVHQHNHGALYPPPGTWPGPPPLPASGADMRRRRTRLRPRGGWLLLAAEKRRRREGEQLELDQAHGARRILSLETRLQIRASRSRPGENKGG